MPITINFCEEFSDLICEDIPKYQLTSVEDRGGYLAGETITIIPEEYRKPFIHTLNGFAAQFCEEY